jgi:hypothetical protein
MSCNVTDRFVTNGVHRFLRGLSVLRVLAAFAVVLAFPMGAQAQSGKTEVDLQLILAVDASGSVNQTRFRLQQLGYAAAFRNPKVLQSIRSGMLQSIAVTMFQWTGPFLQAPVVPWMIVKDEATANALADAIEQSNRELFGGGTSISGAIDFAMGMWVSSPFESSRRTIDVSGDGSNNAGRQVTAARDEAVKAGVGINGLPIVSIEPYLDRYYFDYVIGGPGSFMVPASNYENFGDAILKKLITEIAARDTRDRAVVMKDDAPESREATDTKQASRD